MTLRRWTIAAVISGLAACAGLALYVERVTVLTWLGSTLVVEDQLTHADAILPLAGGTLDREIEAADLFRQGYAPRIVLTSEPELPTLQYLARQGIRLPTADERRLDVLAALGVPRDRVSIVARNVTSTIDEARDVTEWAARNDVHTVILVSSPHHTARAKGIFERYGGSRVKVIARPATLSDFKPSSWWMRRDMLREGIIELEKLLAYRIWY